MGEDERCSKTGAAERGRVEESEEEKEKNVCVAARARYRVSSDLFF